MFRNILTLTLGAVAALAGCRNRPSDADVADASIAFWEARLERQPDDLLAPSELASRYLARFAAGVPLGIAVIWLLVRETGRAGP